MHMRHVGLPLLIFLTLNVVRGVQWPTPSVDAIVSESGRSISLDKVLNGRSRMEKGAEPMETRISQSLPSFGRRFGSNVRRNEASSCRISLIGDEKSDVTVEIQCGDVKIGPQTFNYRSSPESAPDTSELGFDLFLKSGSGDSLQAITIHTDTLLTINRLVVRSLYNITTIFSVIESSLTIDEGVVEDVHGAIIAPLLVAKDGEIVIKNVDCIGTSGVQTGVLVAENTIFMINSCQFKENRGSVMALLFHIYGQSWMEITDSHLSGPLPHTDQDQVQFQLPENFERSSAKAGVAFVSDYSSLVAISSYMEHFPSIQGMVYLEKSSSFDCRDSRLENNIALYGGAVYSADSIVKMRNVRATMNYASRGGAILLEGYSSLDLEAVDFHQNLAIQGGALYIEVHEREIEQDKVVIYLKNCIFRKNTATGMGGGIYSRSVSLTLYTCDFVDNSSESEGGAIYADATAMMNLTNIGFVRNSAGSGGGVFIHSERNSMHLWLTDGTFLNNTASTKSGGAFMVSGTVSVIKIVTVIFNGNRAAVNGGAVYGLDVSSFVAIDGTFHSNKAIKGSGGALYFLNATGVLLKGNVFKNGVAGVYGGHVYIDRSDTVKIDSVVVDGCQAGEDGGAFMLFLVGQLLFENSTIEKCSTAKSGGGLSFKEPLPLSSNLSSNYSRVQIFNSSFNGNSARDGGGLFIISIESIAISNCTFKNNTVVRRGGGRSPTFFVSAVFNVTPVEISGMYLYNITATELKNISATNNQASRSGGALHARSMPECLIHNGQFNHNVAELGGGVADLYGIVSIVVDNTVMQGNKVKQGSGGALEISGVQKLKIGPISTFADNYAFMSGGAIDTNTPKLFTIEKVEFRSNNAKNGSGGALNFYTREYGYNNTFLRRHLLEEESPEEEEEEEYLSLKEVEFERNTAGSHGGALYLNRLNGDVDLDKVFFERNKAENGQGGCLHLSNIHKLEAPHGSHKYNTANGHGGCFFLKNIPKVDITRSLFTSCISGSGKGGALYLHQTNMTGTELLSADLSLATNEAVTGGAYYLSQVEKISLDESSFHRNHATSGSGGGLRVFQSNVVSLVHATMDDNVANRSCGGFCLTRVDTAIVSGTYTANKAEENDGGAAVFRDVNTTTLSGTFGKNKAGLSGGGIKFVNCEKVHVHNGTHFESNVASQSTGGGMDVVLVTLIVVNQTYFSKNVAESGAGIALHAVQRSKNDTLDVQIYQCTFNENTANGNGGGLAVTGQTRSNSDPSTSQRPISLRVEVNSTLFSGNRANNGGGVAIMAGMVNFQKNNFSRNRAKRLGGGLYLDNQLHLTVLNQSLIKRNTAHKGGALVVGCHTKVNFTFAVVSYNAAQRRDDGGMVACDENTIVIANVTFVHNFRGHEWYFYIIFIVGGYALLFLFLIAGQYVFRAFGKRKRSSIVVYNYSDIGERDSDAADLDSFFVNPPAESLSEDEPIIAPKPLPEIGRANPSHSGSHDHPMSTHSSEIREEWAD